MNILLVLLVIGMWLAGGLGLTNDIKKAIKQKWFYVGYFFVLLLVTAGVVMFILNS